MFPIIGGILTIYNDWESQLTKQSIDIGDDGFLDIGCCAYDKRWNRKKTSNETYKYVWREKYPLLEFPMIFINELQLRGTVLAIDISKYLAFLKIY